MRIFLTGATGFIGSHLLRALVNRGDRVAILHRPETFPRRILDLIRRLEVFEGDLSSIHNLSNRIRRFDPDAIIHLAWEGASSSKYADDPIQVMSNRQGSLDLATLAASIGHGTFVGVGTVLECGTYQVPHPESVVPLPTCLYGREKHAVHLGASDILCKSGVRFAWMRLFWAYGPDDAEGRLIPHVIRTFRAGRRPRLTPGEQIWDYLYIDDVVSGIIRIIETSGAEGTFNLGSGNPVAIRDIVIKIRDMINPSLPIGFGDVPYDPHQIMHLQADMSRLRSIGWDCKVDLNEGLRRTLDWVDPLERLSKDG